MEAHTGKFSEQHSHGPRELHLELEEVIIGEHISNPWFTEENIRLAIRGIAMMLNHESLLKWVSRYPELKDKPTDLKIGVIMAGNLPMVGFHDLLCVLLTGHSFLGKASSRDQRLIKKIAEVISHYDPEAGKRIRFFEGPLKNPDGVIATGSNNTSRYFGYYFRDIPHIIRKNRNGVAVISGNETEDDLYRLGQDIFSYFGLGCRNVTKIYLPNQYDPTKLLQAFDHFSYLSQHNKYANNVAYYRTIYLMNSEEFLDNGIVLLKEQGEIASPVGVVYYEYYSEIESLIIQLNSLQQEIQCVVSKNRAIPGAIEPGKSQFPEPWGYADGVDTMAFLTKLYE